MKISLNKKKSTQKDFTQVKNVLEELHNFVNDLFQLKTSEMFRVKLTPAYCIQVGIPDYFTHISRPIDLPTIKEKLEKQEYKIVKEIEDDLNLMFNNCFSYNANKPKIVSAAKKFKDSVDLRVTKMKSNIEMSGFNLDDEINYSVKILPKEAQKYEKEHEQLVNKLTNLIRDLYNLTYAEYFRPKITEEYLFLAKIPHYKQVIKFPMDLATITEKFVAKKYRTTSEIEHDFRLMIENFYTFNTNELVLKPARKFDTAFKQRWAKITQFLNGADIKDNTPIDYDAAKFNITLEELRQKNKDSNSFSLDPESSLHESIFNEDLSLKNIHSYNDPNKPSFLDLPKEKLDRSMSFNPPAITSELSNLSIPRPLRKPLPVPQESFQISIPNPNLVKSYEPQPMPITEPKVPELKKPKSKIETAKQYVDKDRFVDTVEPPFMGKWEHPAPIQKREKVLIKINLPLSSMSEAPTTRGSDVVSNFDTLEDTILPPVRSASFQSIGAENNYSSNKITLFLNRTESDSKPKVPEELNITKQISTPKFETPKPIGDSSQKMDIEHKFEMPKALKKDEPISPTKELDKFKNLSMSTTQSSAPAAQEKMDIEPDPAETNEDQLDTPFFPDVNQIEKKELAVSNLNIIHQVSNESFRLNDELRLRAFNNDSMSVMSMSMRAQSNVSLIQNQPSEIGMEDENKELPPQPEMIENVGSPLRPEEKTFAINKAQAKEAFQALADVKTEKYRKKLPRYVRKLLYLISKDVKIHSTEYKTLKDDIASMNERETLNYSMLLLCLFNTNLVIEHLSKRVPMQITERAAERLLKVSNKLKDLLMKYLEMIDFQFKPEEIDDFNEKRRKFRKALERETKKLREAMEAPSQTSLHDEAATKFVVPISIIPMIKQLPVPQSKKKEEHEDVRTKKAIQEHVSKLKDAQEKMFGRDLLENKIRSYWNQAQSGTSIEFLNPVAERSNSTAMDMEKEKSMKSMHKESSFFENTGFVEFNPDMQSQKTLEQQLSFSLNQPMKRMTSMQEAQNPKLEKLFSKHEEENFNTNSRALRTNEPSKIQKPKPEEKKSVVLKPWNHGIEEEPNALTSQIAENFFFDKTEFSGVVSFNINDYYKGSVVICRVMDVDVVLYGQKDVRDDKKVKEWKEKSGIEAKYDPRVVYGKLNYMKVTFKVNLNKSQEMKGEFVKNNIVKFKVNNLLSNEIKSLFVTLKEKRTESELDLAEYSKLLSHEQLSRQYNDLKRLSSIVDGFELAKYQKFERACCYGRMRKQNQDGSLLDATILIPFEDLSNFSLELATESNKTTKLL